MKFAHISDTHIKNLKYHHEYRVIFEQLYETLRKEKVDYIIHCGDIAHTKTQISPEFVDMCSRFFDSLAAIAPTYIILGNHDGNLKNSSRQDALSPIVNALDNPNLHLLKDSGETLVGKEFCLNVLSVFDRDNWQKPSDPDKINIALYHGSISKCRTDTNWTMTYGEDEISIFDNFDFAMLGDIHRRQYLDNVGRIWYCGSTVQQNHGESNDKGLLIWDIQSKDEWDIEPVVFKNPKPFMTLELSPKGRMPRNADVPEGARLRLVSNNNLPLDIMKRAMDIAKHRFNPESISFLNRAEGYRRSVEELTNTIKTENLRNVNIQEELIDEYLKDYQLSPDMVDKVYELNRKYNKIVEDNEEISRNVNWKLKTFKWNNLFNYGENNEIDFSRLSGIIGIFGKNFSGKSSIIDAILYTLFNTTSKNERKNLNIINQNRDAGDGLIEIEVGDKIYKIERSSEKYTKRLHGEVTLEAKTNLNFEVYDKVTDETTSLNGTTRNQTDANIRKRFGSAEDFLMSSLASQHGAFGFIEEGSTRRKEIIAKFLDLEIFDKKFKLAKEDSIDAKVMLKKHVDREYDTEIAEAKKELGRYKTKVQNNKDICAVMKEGLEKLSEGFGGVEEQINSIPSEYLDIAKLLEDQKNRNGLMIIFDEEIEGQTALIDIKQQKLEKTTDFISSTDLKELTTKKEMIVELQEKVAKLNDEIEEISNNEELLSSIPCGDEYPTCKFIRSAHAQVATRNVVEEELSTSIQELAVLTPKEIEKQIEKIEKITRLIQQLEKEISALKLERERNRSARSNLELELRDLDLNIDKYNENKEVIENLEKLLKVKLDYVARIEEKSTKIVACEEETLELVKQVGSCEQKVQYLVERKQEHIDLRESYAAYDLLMQCMHANGIAYDVIKKKIPVINQEIAKILANIVEFEVFFESAGNKLDIFIKHPKHGARPIEMASGAEKTMGAMAIRLALLSVSSLPKGDLFVLDEPGTALDEENMEGFIRILELIKVYFKNVMLISHLDSLKDCVDMQIVIEKKRGYARVNQ